MGSIEIDECQVVTKEKSDIVGKGSIKEIQKEGTVMEKQLIEELND